MFSSLWLPTQQCYGRATGSTVGLMVTSPKRNYATAPRTTAPVPLPLKQATADPYLCREPPFTDRWAQPLVGAASFLYILVCTRFCVCAPQESLAGMRSDFKVISPHLPPHCGFSFACGLGYLSLMGSNTLLLRVVQQLVGILVFSQE